MELVSLDSPQSPYFVNAADLQVGAIVSPELSEGNYASWRRAFELAVSIKNKIGFIDGSIPRPTEDNRLFAAWRRCDDLVRSWLQKSVSPAIASTIFYLQTARDIWQELEERYGGPDDSRVCRLQLQYHSLVQGSKSISAFYNEMLGILRELREYRPYPKCKCGKCDCGWEKDYAAELQKDMVYKFLNGLNREYGPLRSQILLRKPFPTLGEAYNILQREELQRIMKEDEVHMFGNSVAATTVSGKYQHQETAVKLDQGRMLTFAERRRFRPEVLCEHCGKKGHLKSKCYHLIGFPPNQGYGRGRGQNTSLKQPGWSNSRRLVNMIDGKVQQSPQLALSEAQIQKLLALVSVDNPSQTSAKAHQGQNSESSSPSIETNRVENFAGLVNLDDDWTS